MHNPVQQATRQLQAIITGAMRRAMEEGALPQAELPEFTIEIPNDTKFGDFASNAAMVSARAFRQSPQKIADALLERFDFAGSCFQRAEKAGPGFLNFFLNPDWFGSVVQDILDDGAQYGRSDYGAGEKVMVEFVSANPTGPMHMGNARGGALGDCLASALDAAGYDVTREFYVNDAGNQIEKFGLSLYTRYLQIYRGEEAVPFPEDGYHGDDIRERAQEFADIHGDRYLTADPDEAQKALVDYALPLNIESLRADLARYRIEYDVWFHESTLHKSGAVKEIIDLLTGRGLTYEKEGALWYKATDFGGNKDEVLIRQNGAPSYFAVDIAYHYNKFAVRGFSRVINVWGADHHGHVARLKGSMDAVGLRGDKLDILLMQLVRLLKDGEPYRMSKRTGKSITLADIIEEIPIDAARFFFNMREAGSKLDFDLDLAAEQSSQNPVYYVQYAHARICSILKKLRADGIEFNLEAGDLDRLGAPEERELIRLLASFPNEIIESARSYDPARLTHYAVELATLFHKYYTACRVAGEERGLMQARIALCLAARQTLRNLLDLLKVQAPETM
ncbi:MAG: arginine--tRNA ligase [Provencibacterium sp.]|nr:arginine--tRNA ligase [Provencibacterium sp.]